jgi:hypothetical protein
MRQRHHAPVGRGRREPSDEIWAGLAGPRRAGLVVPGPQCGTRTKLLRVTPFLGPSVACAVAGAVRALRTATATSRGGRACRNSPSAQLSICARRHRGHLHSARFASEQRRRTPVRLAARRGAVDARRRACDTLPMTAGPRSTPAGATALGR